MKTCAGLFCSLLFLFLMGCAPTLKGEVFKEITEIPKDEAVIYLYWTDKKDEKCVADFSVKANGQIITDIKFGGYYKYSTSETYLTIETHVNFKLMVVGALDVAMVNSRKISGNVQHGNIYFVRCSLIRLNSAAPGQLELSMKKVDQKRGMYEIRGAKLLPQKS